MYAFCRSQALGAWRAFARVVNHDPLPNTLKGSAACGAGCCLFPVMSFALWSVVLLGWAFLFLILGTYALVMTLGWGVGALLPHRRVVPVVAGSSDPPLAAPTPPGPSAAAPPEGWPEPPPLPSGVLVTPDGKWISYDGGETYVRGPAAERRFGGSSR